jgi:hypothetical protein
LSALTIKRKPRITSGDYRVYHYRFHPDATRNRPQAQLDPAIPCFATLGPSFQKRSYPMLELAKKGHAQRMGGQQDYQRFFTLICPHPGLLIIPVNPVGP